MASDLQTGNTSFSNRDAGGWPAPWQWTGTIAEAQEYQRQLASQVQIVPLRQPVRYILGLDCAFVRKQGAEWIVAGAVLWDVKKQQVVQQQVYVGSVTFPYVPGLLAFREMPALTQVVQTMPQPDLIMVDGQGIAHPRRLGIASQFGLWAGCPTVGVAKSRLVGTYEPFPLQRGQWRPLYHRGEQIGTVVCTRDHVRPLFISPGHLIDFEGATRWTLQTALRYRLPEPTRQAHLLVSRARKEVAEKGFINSS